MEDAERDLDLAVELINTHWLLAHPPDRLTDVAVYQDILRAAGCADLADQLSPSDLAPLLELRAQLAPVFAAGTVDAAVMLLDALLGDTLVPARLSTSGGAVNWHWGADQTGMAALRMRLLAALAVHLVRYGTTRLGVCRAEPCRCVYVDRSRARTRRYCCDQCNDRAAAAAYRQRRQGLS